METLIINTHLTYPGWSEGKLNLTLMELAKTFFVERGHTVTETMVERGYKTDEEISKHAAADLVNAADDAFYGFLEGKIRPQDQTPADRRLWAAA